MSLIAGVSASLFLQKNCDLDLKSQMRKYYCCNLYCAPFWYDSTKAAMENLKVAYNNSLRTLLGLPNHNSASGMFVNLNILSFEELLRK